jgi:hypothetical protein
VGFLWETHGEYIRKGRSGGRNSTARQGPSPGGDQHTAGTFSPQGYGRSPGVTCTHGPLNHYSDDERLARLEDIVSVMSNGLTWLTWAANRWGGAIPIFLGITLFLAGASIRAHSL